MQEPTVNITVAIPTYSGAKRLPIIFDALKAQSLPESINWEILVVDNNSSDNTKEIVEKYKELLPNLSYTFEPKQGVAYARWRAVREGRGALIGFLDDDVEPDKNWVRMAIAFFYAHPKAGAHSGKIIGKYEVDPPEYFRDFQHNLGIEDRGPNEKLYRPDRVFIPPAGSLVVLKKAWLDNVPTNPWLKGRSKGFPVQGDDYEPLIYINKAGYEVWYNPAMISYHHIPAYRLEEKWLKYIAKINGFSSFPLWIMGRKAIEIPIALLRMVRIFTRIMISNIRKYRGKIFTETIPKCCMLFLVCGILSPFWFLFHMSMFKKEMTTNDK